MKKRLLSMLLALSMVIGMLPMTALAAEVEVDPHGLCTEGHVHNDDCGVNCTHTHDDKCYPTTYVKEDWVKCEREKTCNNYWRFIHQIWLWDECILGSWLNDIYNTNEFDGGLLVYYHYVGRAWNCTHTHDETCFDCGKESGSGAGGHVWDEGTPSPAATCTEGGKIKYVCENNPDHVYYEDVDALEHSFTDYVSNNDATCEKDGTKTAECDNGCGEKDTVTDEGSALKHDMQKTADEVAPECEVPGKTAVYTCANGCGKTEGGDPIDALEHTWGDWAVTKAPSASEKGEAKRVCGRDATHVETKVLPKLPVDENGNFTGGEGYAFEVIDEPTCTENGLGKYTYTEKENDTVIFEISFEVVIPATGHEYEGIETAPTCTKPGFATYTCSKCKDTYVVTEHEHTGECYKTCDGAADTTHEHSPECYVAEWNEQILGDGWFTCPRILCWYCATNQPTFSGNEMIEAYFNNTAIDLIPSWIANAAQYHPVRPVASSCDFESTHTHTDACGKCAWDALGHDMGDWAETKAPTCVDAGEERSDCSRCDHFETRPIAATGEHTYGAFGKVVKPATCEDKGVAEHYCTVCGDVKKVDIEALGHKAGEPVDENEVPATCTENGTIDHVVYCERCDKELDRVTEILFATGHTCGIFGKVDVAPDCENEGTAVYYCTVCGEPCKKEPIPALGHKAGEPVDENYYAPTCEKGGSIQHVTYCTREGCGVELERLSQLLPKLGHDMVTDEAVAPDCENTGLTEGAHCSRCEDATIAQEVVPALGHDMGDWYVTKQPTYNSKGEERRDCSRCDYFETREIDEKVKPVTPVGPAKPEVTTKYLNTKDHVAYIIGYADGTVRPNGNITRAEIATIYFRLLTDENREEFWATENGFADVNANDWFNLAVSTLDNAGVIVDVKDGNFRPNDPITRAELSVMAAQFCKVTGKLPKTSFSDLDKDYWAYDEITLIEYAGWIKGYPDGTFRPDNTVTRAEAMTIINRMLERAVEEDDMLEGMLTFVDCPNAEWFYEAIQEATNSHDYKRSKDKVEDYGYKYEIWTELLEAPNWAAMEQAWINAR